jgi:hypothetical protein
LSPNDWLQHAIEAGALDSSHPYVGLSSEEIAKLADSAFGERPLLIQLRSAHGDWRIVKDAKWYVAWCAAAEPEPRTRPPVRARRSTRCLPGRTIRGREPDLSPMLSGASMAVERRAAKNNSRPSCFRFGVRDS